ncbi:MAG: T9SS type A sorting domain-containing protein [Salinivenus sp.]
MFYSSVSRPLLLFVLLSVLLALPAPAQEVLVQNGATVEVANSGVVELQGATMDFGEPGATARLNETDRGRMAGGLLTAVRVLNGAKGIDVAGLGAELTTRADLGEVTVTRGHAVQTGGGNESIRRYYAINPSQNNSGLDATLTHAYNDAELNGLSESDLELFTSTDGGSTWSEEGVDSRDAQANTVTLSGIQSFSRWTLGSESNPLPVELARFEAARTEAAGDETAVRLTWQTASETNNAGFRVERARAGGLGSESAWTKVGFVEGAGTTSEAQSYRFTDTDLPYAADTLEYRLRQVDTDGSATLTDPVAVDRGGPETLQLKETYPNPARDRVTVRFAVPDDRRDEGQEATLRLYDVLGRVVRTVQAEAEAGRHERQLSVQDLSSGVYILRLGAGDRTETRRLTVVR